MKLLVIFAIAGLSAPCAALAQDALATPPAASTSPAEVLTGVSAQSREDQIGDKRTYVSETRSQAPTGQTSFNRQTFSLETMAVTRNKLLMRYQLTQAEATDEARPYLSPLLQAYVGIPIEFESDMNGSPLRIINWTRVSQALTDNLARALPNEEPLRTGTMASLNAMPDQARAQAILSDVAALAQMQPRGPVRQGRVEAAPEQTPLPDGAVATRTRFAEMDAIDPARCTARIQSGSVVEVQGRPDKITDTLTGELSTLDGWANSLESRVETTAQAGTFTRTLTISRDQAPGCS